MVPVRLRHPKGIATLQLDLDALTVQDLQQQIFTLSEIPPPQQEGELVPYHPSCAFDRPFDPLTSQIGVPPTNVDPRARITPLQFGSPSRRPSHRESEGAHRHDD